MLYCVSAKNRDSLVIIELKRAIWTVTTLFILRLLMPLLLTFRFLDRIKCESVKIWKLNGLSFEALIFLEFRNCNFIWLKNDLFSQFLATLSDHRIMELTQEILKKSLFSLIIYQMKMLIDIQKFFIFKSTVKFALELSQCIQGKSIRS